MQYQLWLSFTACLRAVVREGLDIWDPRLLFYFGCARVHVMDPVAEQKYHEVTWFVEGDLEKHEDFMVNFAAAIKKAEAEGRVLWRVKDDDGGLANSQNLTRFLQGHGVSLPDTIAEEHPAYPSGMFGAGYGITTSLLEQFAPGLDVRC